MIEHHQPITHHTSRITRALQGACHDNANRLLTFSHTGLTATIKTGVTDTSLPLALNVASTVPPGNYPYAKVSERILLLSDANRV